MPEKNLPSSPDGFMSGLHSRNQLWAEAVPASSRVIIHVNPANPEEMLNLQVFAFREELMHAERQKFGLTRNVALLKDRARERLFSVLQGEIDPSLAAIEIEHFLHKRDEIIARQEPFLETVDQYLTHSVMKENGYLEDYATEFAERHDRDESQVLEYLRSLREQLEEQRIPSIGSKEVFDKLRDIEAEYNKYVAEAVADAALDIPYTIEPLELDGFPSRSVESIDLYARFEAAVDAVRRLDFDLDTMDRDMLIDRLQQDIQHPEVSERGRRLREMEIKLLDIPIATLNNENTAQDRIHIAQTSQSELGKILHGVFQSVGTLGGAIYKLESDEDANQPLLNWLVNPWIHDEKVNDGKTYAELWQRAYLGDRLLNQFNDIKSNPCEVYEIVCPFCQISRWELCGGETCCCQWYIDAAREKQGRLVDELRIANSEM